MSIPLAYAYSKSSGEGSPYITKELGKPNFLNNARNGSRMLDWWIKTASELLYISRISHSVLLLLRNQPY